MKNLSFFGVVILAIGATLYYFNQPIDKLPLIIGILCGVGLGLILGGIIGYISKGSAIKEKLQREEFQKIQQEREELKRQVEELRKASGNI